MATLSYSIGTTSKPVASVVLANEFLDIIVQNLSANNVYVGSDASVTTTDGLRVVANGNYTNSARGEPVWLIADGAASDVRVQFHNYLDSTKARV